jgi:two-component system OmpR family sensor kinase
MHFDDRLATVMRLPASSAALARIQYRQLLDLLGRAPAGARSQVFDAALARVEELGASIPAPERARLLSQPLQPIANPRLLALLAASETEVAIAAIAGARLSEAEWLKLIPELPVRARGILRHRRDLGARVETLLEALGVHDRALPAAATSKAPAPSATADVLELAPDTIMEPAAVPSPSRVSASVDPVVEWARAAAAVKAEQPGSGGAEAEIGAIVRRIEEFRKARENRESHSAPSPANDKPAIPSDEGGTRPHEAPLTIDFETDENGRITWAGGPCAPSLVGLNLAACALGDPLARSNGWGAPGRAFASSDVATIIRHRLPLRAARVGITGAPAVSGEWQVDAIGCFDSGSGGFIGYSGRLRRPARQADKARTGRNVTEADRMRQILHELRTPANAIQVAAEIIQQQLYGPAPHEYRALAAAIAGDCAHILAGFEELDRLVKLEAGVLCPETGDCDLGPILVQTVARLRSWTDPRRSGFALPADIRDAMLPVQVDAAEAERLVWRLLAALAGSTAPDEVLELGWARQPGDGRNDTLVLRIALPKALAAQDSGALFDSPPGEHGQALSTGMFGLGFTLRLAAAEAGALGGALQRDGKDLHLILPGLTDAAEAHTAAPRCC